MRARRIRIAGKTEMPVQKVDERYPGLMYNIVKYFFLFQLLRKSTQDTNNSMYTIKIIFSYRTMMIIFISECNLLKEHSKWV